MMKLSSRMYRFIMRDKPRHLSPIPAATLASAVLLLGGCSIAVPVGGLLGNDDPPTTASVGGKGAAMLSPELAPEDWQFARMALGTALDPLGTGAVAPWANPRTGIRGDFVALGKPYLENDLVCRRFGANLQYQGQSEALKGSACRLPDGQWATMDVSGA
ncbi:RT0821/Lpp0805 family surface protein [Pseudochelatococcus lubricantis]|uniref:RT0821/Lpp0805 family surface protein n=1 Tax=Pseudochelatococcus lubricantis TaxID=1538102 RepID=UPI0035EE86D2